MPRILLSRPEYGTRLSQRAWLVTEPLDLEYLAAIAGELGCEYRIHDPVVTGDTLEEVLEAFSPDIVAITGYYPAMKTMLDHARRTKKKSSRILTIIGGVHAELNHTDFHHDNVDIVVHSDGANTFRSILQAVITGDDPKTLDGICSRNHNNDWQCGAGRPFNPTTLPLPDRSHFNQYRERFTYLHHGPVALLKTAYGCPFDCRFCYCRLLNNGVFTERSLEEVVKEIEIIDCDTIWIIDDTFLLDMERIKSFASLLRREGIRKHFIIYSRSEFIANHPDVVPVLQSMGVIDVIVGFESINEQKLDAYRKRNAEAEGRKCIKLLHDNGIECTGLFIMDVDATRCDFRALDRWIKDTGLKTYTLSIFTPYPGTEPFEEHRERLTTSDCTKWDFTHLVMNPTRMSRPAFYMRVLGMHLKLLVRNSALRKPVCARIFRRRSRRTIWDFWAGRYESLWVQRFSLGPTRREIIRNIPVRSGMNILDMGCGTGQLFGSLKEHFGDVSFSYTGVDQSHQMIHLAGSRHPAGRFIIASSETFHAPGETYDVIVCAHSFPYFPSKHTAIQRMEAMLKADGMLIIAQASMNNLYDAAVMAAVKLTTSRASYPSRRKMRLLAQPAFPHVPEESRISPNLLIPSIYLFKWTRSDEVSP